ncbi:hypothetical protein D3C73_20910 [compost metagenome]
MIKQASTRTNQGGSILIFTIVAVLLALALVGAVLFIRNKGEVAQTQVPIMGPIAPPEAAPGKNGDNKSEEGAKSTPPRSDAKPEPETSPPNNGSSNNTSSASELPKTGPADALAGMLVLGLVTMTLVSYMRSRRLSWQL